MGTGIDEFELEDKKFAGKKVTGIFIIDLIFVFGALALRDV